MNTEIDIDKLEGLAKAATPGPWRRQDFHSGGPKNGIDSPEGEVICASYGHTRPMDFEFMAAANPSAILALLDCLRNAEAERTVLAYRLRDCIASMAGYRREMVMAGMEGGSQPCDAERRATDALAALKINDRPAGESK